MFLFKYSGVCFTICGCTFGPIIEGTCGDGISEVGTGVEIDIGTRGVIGIEGIEGAEIEVGIIDVVNEVCTDEVGRGFDGMMGELIGGGAIGGIVLTLGGVIGMLGTEDIAGLFAMGDIGMIGIDWIGICRGCMG